MKDVGSWALGNRTLVWLLTALNYAQKAVESAKKRNHQLEKETPMHNL